MKKQRENGKTTIRDRLVSRKTVKGRSKRRERNLHRNTQEEQMPENVPTYNEGIYYYYYCC